MPDSAEEHVSCRICMDPKDSYVSLFSHNLSMKVMEVADVQVEKDDGLPSSICTECEQDLEKCYEFRLKVQVSDKKLRENIKLTQVDIVECNIKEERYMDDGDSDNLEDKDSGSMDDEHYDDEPDVAPRISEETEEAEPDPLNHVVVVEENERKMEMTEEPSTQDDMVEEPQVQKIEEVALDPLVCMKQEAETEIMDVDSNMPDPFGPSSSVRSTEFPFFTPPSSSPLLTSTKTNIIGKEIKREPETVWMSETIEAWQDTMLQKKPEVSLLSQGINAHGYFNEGQRSTPLPLQAGSAQNHSYEGYSSSALPIQTDNTVSHSYTGHSLPRPPLLLKAGNVQGHSYPVQSLSAFPLQASHSHAEQSFTELPLQAGNPKGHSYVEQSFTELTLQTGNSKGHSYAGESFPALPFQSGSIKGNFYKEHSLQTLPHSAPSHSYPVQSYSTLASQVVSPQSHFYAGQSFPALPLRDKSTNRFSDPNTKKAQQLHTNSMFLSKLATNVPEQRESLILYHSNTNSQRDSLFVDNIRQVNVQNASTSFENASNQRSFASKISNDNMGQTINKQDLATVVAGVSVCDTNISSQCMTKSLGNKNTSKPEEDVTNETGSDSRSSKSSQQNSEEIESNECFCSVCNVNFGSPDLLEDHTTERKEFICRACTAIFNNHKELETHFFSHKKFICKVCNKAFYVKRDLVLHRREVLKCKRPVFLKCEKCSNKFVYEKNLQIHMKRKHGNTDSQTIICRICNSIIKSHSYLMTHLEKSHPAYENMECDICHNILLGPERLKAHIKSIHLQPVVSCPICQKVLSSNATLKNHIEAHNETEVICEVCGKVIKGQGVHFRNHMKLHQNKTFSCNTCSQTFNSLIDRRKHFNKEHRKRREEKPVICEICGKEYKSKFILKYHMAIHSDDKPYVCEICGAAFKAQIALKTHSRIHSNLHKYHCKDCGEGFKWKQTFDKHVLKCESSLDRN